MPASCDDKSRYDILSEHKGAYNAYFCPMSGGSRHTVTRVNVISKLLASGNQIDLRQPHARLKKHTFSPPSVVHLETLFATKLRSNVGLNDG